MDSTSVTRLLVMLAIVFFPSREYKFTILSIGPLICIYDSISSFFNAQKIFFPQQHILYYNSRHHFCLAFIIDSVATHFSLQISNQLIKANLLVQVFCFNRPWFYFPDYNILMHKLPNVYLQNSQGVVK